MSDFSVLVFAVETLVIQVSANPDAKPRPLAPLHPDGKSFAGWVSRVERSITVFPLIWAAHTEVKALNYSRVRV